MTHDITDEQTSEALRLSDALEDMACIWSPSDNRDLVNRAAAELRRLALAAPQGEPFGHFRALPFGWEQCAEDDEGAIALYTAPAPAPAVPSIDYMALIAAAWGRHKYAQGTRGCVAFKHGAEWFREKALTAARTQAGASHE